MLALCFLQISCSFLVVNTFSYIGDGSGNLLDDSQSRVEKIPIPSIRFDPAKIDSTIRAVQNCAKMPGVMLAIVQTDKNDNIIHQYTKGYGILNPAVPNSPGANADTRFCIGSITKQFTAALVGQILHDNGNT